MMLKQVILSVLLAGSVMGAGWMMAQDAPEAMDPAAASAGYQASEGFDEKTVIYLQNNDYPPSTMISYPSHPVRETRFWQELDRSMRNTGKLMLSESVEDADYRVSLECAGIFKCTKLKVYIKTLERDILSSYTIHGIRGPLGLWNQSTAKVADRLSESLAEKMDLLSRGGYGYHGGHKKNGSIFDF